MSDKPWTAINNKEYVDGTLADKVSRDEVSTGQSVAGQSVTGRSVHRTKCRGQSVAGRSVTGRNDGTWLRQCFLVIEFMLLIQKKILSVVFRKV